MEIFLIIPVRPILSYNAMACHNPKCLGNYDFDHIAFFAIKRFVEGCDTVTLLGQAESECEKEEIALVCLLDVADNKIRDLELCCRHAGHCKVIDCRDKLKKMIKEELTNRKLA
ncbi:MAG: hypothetical protein KAJ65_04895 [Gammaproteobacteria bacterium]|nr:hypothetical protein [Gammaproteobacteria bacterium]